MESEFDILEKISLLWVGLGNLGDILEILDSDFAIWDGYLVFELIHLCFNWCIWYVGQHI